MDRSARAIGAKADVTKVSVREVAYVMDPSLTGSDTTINRSAEDPDDDYKQQLAELDSLKLF